MPDKPLNKQVKRDFKGVWVPREIYLAKDLSWSEKILLIEIDSLDADERGCFASNQFLADFLGLSAGRVANMISNLKSKEYLQQLFFDGHNRGLRTILHGQNLNKKVKVNLHEKVKEPSRKSESEPSRKREHSNTEEFLVIQEEKREGVPPSRKSKKESDPRSSHPAIAALRDLTKLFPPQELWDTIIAELGDTPDLDRLRSCFIEWRTRDFRPTNYAWAREWYRYGIPNMNGWLGRPHRPATNIVPIESDDLQTSLPHRDRRPPDDSPHEHRELWRSVLEALRPRMSIQVFGAWFDKIIFDGLNDEMNAFKVRADQYTKDWITRYYSDAIYETLTTLNLGEFTLQWEIEEEFEESIAA